jgi:ComF family protein
MKRVKLIDIFDAFVSLLFPRVCIGCKKALIHQEEVLCTGCRWTLPQTNYHTAHSHALQQKFIYEIKVKFVASYLFYQRHGIAQHLIHALKYKNRPEVGYVLGQWYAQSISNINFNADLLIPVPIHTKKLQSRGYNQSESFAKGLSEILGIPVDTTSVIRNVHTNTQTKKSKVDRWLNVESVFEVVNPETLFDKHVVIVDDVITTGATIGYLIEVLVAAKVSAISILGIASGK